MKVDESYTMACHDRIISGRQEKLLLDKDRTVSLLQDMFSLDVSPQLMEYLLCSIAQVPAMPEESIKQLTQWLNRRDPLQSDALFETVLTHYAHQIRAGVIKLIKEIGDHRIAEHVMIHLKREYDRQVKRAMLHCPHHFGKRLPSEVAQALLQHDPDWVVQSKTE